MSLDHPKTVQLFSLVMTKAELKKVADARRNLAYQIAWTAYGAIVQTADDTLRVATEAHQVSIDAGRAICDVGIADATRAHQAAYRLADKLPEA